MRTGTRGMILEVCIASVEDASAAKAGGADRLELNCALALGGLTPSLGLLREVKQKVALPVIAMARPRSGGFHYSATEFRVLQRDVQTSLENGAAGVAFGVLTQEGEIDTGRCREVIREIGDAEAVFHRAFDVTSDPHRALEGLIDLGVRRVMTSGQAPTALEGAELIAKLIEQSGGRIEVLPAAGINPGTVTEVLRRTGCDQVHASLRMKHYDDFEATDPGAVREMRKLLGR